MDRIAGIFEDPAAQAAQSMNRIRQVLFAPSFSIGIADEQDMMQVLIPRGSPIPCKAQSRQFPIKIDREQATATVKVTLSVTKRQMRRI